MFTCILILNYMLVDCTFDFLSFDAYHKELLFLFGWLFVLCLHNLNCIGQFVSVL